MTNDYFDNLIVPNVKILIKNKPTQGENIFLFGFSNKRKFRRKVTKNGEYTAEDIDEKVLRYVDAYIKRILKYTKVDYIKELPNRRKYMDLLQKLKDGLLTAEIAERDIYIIFDLNH